METNLQPPTTTTTTTHLNDVVPINNHNYFDDDSNCSTPYVSAPSSPVQPSTTIFLSPPPHPSAFFFYSAPTSPMHYVLSSAAAAGRPSLAPALISDASSSESFEFDFSSRLDSPAVSEIVAADELFLNGQIRPMKLSAHLSRPQHLIDDIIEDVDEEEDNKNDVVFNRSRDLNLRDKSQRRRRTRSMSPMRNTTPFDWILPSDDVVPTSPPEKSEKHDAVEFPSASSSRCSSARRSSKRWVLLKDFLRSKSEGRSNNKFWQNINMSFSAAAKEKEKKPTAAERRKSSGNVKKAAARRSAHEIHYAANRAQAEEMRKKTYLPYRQGLLGCLGFNSKTYGAFNGFATALNPVSST